jgi:cohesin domain-containing protein
MPYRYAGKLLQGGRQSVLLAKGDTVFPVNEGETLDGAYRVESVGETEVTLMYLPLALEERILVDSSLPVAASATRLDLAAAAGGEQAASATAAPARERGSPGGGKLASQSMPAQLLWEGPQQVKLGTRFEVVLRVTSDQPLQASPMRLRFDPAYLEFVAVKPGKFLDSMDRNFTYRASPDGSIFVGASIQDPASATGAELLVLTFGAVKTAAAAELSIASLNLQGAGGQAVAFSQPAAYKIAISP